MLETLKNVLITISIMVGATLNVTFAHSQELAPALGQAFTVPMSNGENAIMMVAARDSQGIILVSSTNSTRLALWRLTLLTPTPITDPPIVVDPPKPPEPPKPEIVALITITESTLNNWDNDCLAYLQSVKVTPYNWSISMVADPDPPANSLTWIGRIAGKKLPYSFLAGQDGKIVWQGARPSNLEELKKLIGGPPATNKFNGCCPSGICKPSKARS